MSNSAFNNTMFSARTIPRMESDHIHASMARLYEAAKELQKVEGQSAVARLLNLSPQRMNNWERRGISQMGAVKAQEVVGCDANWILTGAGTMRPPKVSDEAARLVGAVVGLPDDLREAALAGVRNVIELAQAAARARGLNQTSTADDVSAEQPPVKRNQRR